MFTFNIQVVFELELEFFTFFSTFETIGENFAILFLEFFANTTLIEIGDFPVLLGKFL